MAPGGAAGPCGDASDGRQLGATEIGAGHVGVWEMGCTGSKNHFIRAVAVFSIIPVAKEITDFRPLQSWNKGGTHQNT
jgi:hypothetical protein